MEIGGRGWVEVKKGGLVWRKVREKVEREEGERYCQYPETSNVMLEVPITGWALELLYANLIIYPDMTLVVRLSVTVACSPTTLLVVFIAPTVMTLALIPILVVP